MNNSIFIVLYLHFWSLIRETKSFRHRNFMCFVCILKLIFLVSQWNIWFQYNDLKVIICVSRVHKMDSSTRCMQRQCTAIHTQNDFQNSVLQVKKSGSGKKLYWKKKWNQCFQWNHNKTKYKRKGSYIKKSYYLELDCCSIRNDKSKETEGLCKGDWCRRLKELKRLFQQVHRELIEK